MSLDLSNGKIWSVLQQQELSAQTAMAAAVPEQPAIPAMVLAFAVNFVTTEL